MLLVRRQKCLRTGFHTGESRFRGCSPMPSALRRTKLLERHELVIENSTTKNSLNYVVLTLTFAKLTFAQGSGAMEASDRGPEFSLVAGENTVRAGAAASPANLGAADKQARGALARQRRRYLPGSREARC